MLKLIIPSSIALCLTACTLSSPEDLLNKQLAKTEGEYRQELERQQRQAKPLAITLTWYQALDKLYRSNPDILQANFRIEDSRDNMKTVWRNMIPSLSASISDTATLENLATLFEDSNLRVSSFISLSNLLTLRKTIYTNKLTLISTELASEQTMRNQVIALYRLFQEQQLHDLEQDAIQYQQELVNAEHEDYRSFNYVTAVKNIEDQLEALEQKRISWRQQVNNLFMGSYTKVNLKYSTLPNIVYTPNQLDLENAKRWGRLQLHLLALESIADEAGNKALYARYYPKGFLSVSAPALYQSFSSTKFRIEDIRLSPSLSWSLDTRDTIGRSIDKNNRQKAIQDWNKNKRRAEEVAKLLEGKLALKKVQKEIRDLQEEIKEYQSLVRSGDIYQLDLRKAADEIIQMKEKEISLKAKEIDISSSFWLLDETRWKSITKNWKRVRLEQEANRRKARGKIPFFRKKPKTS